VNNSKWEGIIRLAIRSRWWNKWCQYRFASNLFFIHTGNCRTYLWWHQLLFYKSTTQTQSSARCYKWGSFRTEKEETVYKSVNSVASQESSDHLAYTKEFLSSLIPIGMRPHEFKLKVSTVILVHPNIMPSRRLYIGTVFLNSGVMPVSIYSTVSDIRK
jgi:hypothetical protein